MIPTKRLCAHCNIIIANDLTVCPACGYILRQATDIVSLTENIPLSDSLSRRGTVDIVTKKLVLQGRYVLEEIIGQGGTGKVYRAGDKHLPYKHWAIKEMIFTSISPEEKQKSIEAFRREAHILVQLSYPNLPQVADSFEEEGSYYLVMELVQGKTLSQLLLDRGSPIGDS